MAPESTVLAQSAIEEGGQTISVDPISYQETLSWGVRFCVFFGLGACA